MLFATLPHLLVFYLFGSFLLRMAASFVFFYLAKDHMTNLRSQGTLSSTSKTALWVLLVVEVAVGVSLFLGAFMQIGALLGMLVAVGLKALSFRHSPAATHGKTVYFLLFMICFALLFLGAGAFAFDLPL